MTINTHNLFIKFGKHKGERWTRIPVSYLKWLVNQPEVILGMEKNKEIAQAELDRRGVTISSDIEISKHAIDKASLRLRKVWHETALNDDEGLYSWLQRVADEAVKTTDKKPERIKYLGIKFVFKWGNKFPILKTVIK